jgi:hypothetical protein
MDNYSLIELLQKEIQRAACDARTEPQLAAALEKGLSPDDFLVSCDNLFCREYSRDIVFTELKEDSRNQPLLQLHLSRSGVYDQLPEGLFFQPAEQKRGYSAADMAADHKLNKKKEAEIRRFFLPFENDFYWQRIQIEQEESKLLEGLKSGILNDYFMRFWGIPEEIPRHFIVPLLLLLPYAHRVAGDLPLMAECLQQLLQEKVTARKMSPPLGDAMGVDAPGLGEAQAGLDMVCGVLFTEDLPVIEWSIGPLEASTVQDYLEGGQRYRLMETFTRFFVPAGVDTSLVIRVDPGQRQMVLGDQQGAILGYSCELPVS